MKTKNVVPFNDNLLFEAAALDAMGLEVELEDLPHWTAEIAQKFDRQYGDLDEETFLSLIK